MDIFNVLALVGGLALFLFGMGIMGDALEKKAGGQFKNILSSMTNNPIKGFLLGLGVTSIIQSSSATTVMVVGFVNSGIMTLRQAINIIMGANVGTTVTAWLLSLTGISGDSLFVQMLKPTSFTPILALIGIVLYMFCKGKKKDNGVILLGFAVLMFGMDTMASAVAGLKDVPEFQNILLMFSNPILGVIAGAVLTGIIQSSSASVGILQALSTTGQVTYGSAIPIIMGQNIGTCVTALISSVGTNKNARRAAVVHLMFNIIGTVVWLVVFYIANAIFRFEFINTRIDTMGIAVVHSAFNILCTALLLPMGGLLEKIAIKLIPDSKENEKFQLLDTRLLTNPGVAVERCRLVTCQMADVAINTMESSLTLLNEFNQQTAKNVRDGEAEVDEYEDHISSYLVKAGTGDMSAADSMEASKLLHILGDFERISDHAVNFVESAEEIKDKKFAFSDGAKNELCVMMGAVNEILTITLDAFKNNDVKLAAQVEPLEQVVDDLKEKIKSSHIERLRNGECSIEMGFILSDMLITLERVADHCSNVAVCIIEMSHNQMDMHGYIKNLRKQDRSFELLYSGYSQKYHL